MNKSEEINNYNCPVCGRRSLIKNGFQRTKVINIAFFIFLVFFFKEAQLLFAMLQDNLPIIRLSLSLHKFKIHFFELFLFHLFFTSLQLLFAFDTFSIMFQLFLNMSLSLDRSKSKIIIEIQRSFFIVLNQRVFCCCFFFGVHTLKPFH